MQPATAAAPHSPERADPEGSRRRTRRVLLVSGHSFLRRNLSFLFEREGFGFAHCETAARARDQVSAANPDVIILDAVLPDRPGFDLCAELSQDAEFGRIPILLFALETVPLFNARCAAAGAHGCLNFPADVTEVVGVIENASAGVPAVGAVVEVLPAGRGAPYTTRIRAALPGRRVLLASECDNRSMPMLPRDCPVRLRRVSHGVGPATWEGTVVSSSLGRGVEVELVRPVETAADARQAARLPVGLVAVYRSDQGPERQVRVSNLSIAGMRVTGLEEPLSAGDLLGMTLCVDEAEIPMLAEVRWVREFPGQGMCAGIAFRDLAPAGRERILRHLFSKASA